ncbi:glycosyltransferase family 10 domain-containing protein [Psychromonas antarctica]|uniref:glycosyltransferase family 10 domain-containing protein n=1 Tax=Psychromonas antarctica TaxID=67573 RepID=UPI001EE8EACD|nr:glycosyltransferase family 10 [Psychromonas antarctica]MCG6202759.1 glycosyltransferase family 10 [Psychromonas antarctica]
MKKICLVISKYLHNNEIFNVNSKLNRDGIFNKYIQLRKEFLKFNCELSTSDINSIETSDAVLYFDMPKELPTRDKIDTSYLVLVESELIRPDNYQLKKHSYFKKIFTWHDGIVDDKKYYKLNFSHLFPSEINKELSNKKKLFTLIAGNKKSPIKSRDELYSKRVEAVRWFEKYHPEDFDLYGVGWGARRFEGPKLIRGLNRVPYLGSFYAICTGQVYPSYQGMVDNKKGVMERYKFSICYENVKNIPGYITEKIFDSFFAGCVPIYWGANNITDYIPATCFIDKRNFDTYEELYEYIVMISDESYMQYLENIEEFLCSQVSYQFTGKGFAEKVVSIISRGFDDN